MKNGLTHFLVKLFFSSRYGSSKCEVPILITPFSLNVCENIHKNMKSIN